MLHKIVYFVLLFNYAIAYSQDNVGDYSFGSNTKSNNTESSKLGGYLGITVNYTDLNNRDGWIIGMRGGPIFRNLIGVGLVGYIFINQSHPNTELGEILRFSYGLEGTYGGVFFEPILTPTYKLHVSFPITFGMGMVAYISDDLFSMGWNNVVLASSSFKLIEPGVELDFLILPFLKLSLGGYYRFSTNVNLQTYSYNTGRVVKLTDDTVMDGFTVGISLKIGKFRTRL